MKKHPLWPTLIVLAGYITADLLLDGIEAALFVVGLGLLEFLILLVIARLSIPSLILEGAVLGGLGYAGELIGKPGAGFMLLELVAAAVFLLSVSVGRPYLGRQVRTLTGSGINPRLAGRMTSVLGTVFLVHGIILLVMMLTTGITILPALASFAVLYLAALLFLRKGSRSEATGTLPVLLPVENGRTSVVRGGSVLGSVRITGDRITEVEALSLSGEVSLNEFIPVLEVLLGARGVRTVRFPDWQGDTSPLEIAGYGLVSGCWQRVLPAFLQVRE